MQHLLRQYIPVGMALYAICVFGTAPAIAQISAANSPEEGIWVQLCASGSVVFIPLSKLTGEEKPAPNGGGGGTVKGCHACVDKRGEDGGDSDILDT